MRRRMSGGVGQVGCVFGAGAAEGEDSGLGGDGAEDGVGLGGGEVDDVLEVEGSGHRRIVVGFLQVGPKLMGGELKA